MPTPTSKAETRSERLIRLAILAAEDLQTEIKPDEASGTDNQVSFVFEIAGRGTGRIIVGVPGDEILVSGTLTRADGMPVRLHRGNRPQFLMTADLFDRCSDTSNRRSIEQMFRKLITAAHPPRNKKLEAELVAA
ncbi:hypothetical protein EPO04_00500 [Patescibacteria group bacterium]|nr:MAG: hypothetical protein EPO04_00500 [Patescibacteria group bacterium]